MLHVDGYKILDENDNDFTIKGVSFIDIGECHPTFKAKLDLALKFWNINTVRIPVYPPAQTSNDHYSSWPYKPDNNLIQNAIVPAVSYAEALGLQAIVDFHQIAELDDDSADRTIEFWTEALQHLGDFDNLIVEIYNEPINANADPVWNSTPTECWTNVKPHLQRIVDALRLETNQLIIVPTPVYCRLPQGANADPLNGNNIAYSAHIYSPKVWEQEGFGVVVEGQSTFNYAVLDQINNSSNVPFVITELGFEEKNGEFVNVVKQFVQDNPHIGYVAWVLNDRWWPPLLTKDNVPTDFGKVMKTIMA